MRGQVFVKAQAGLFRQPGALQALNEIFRMGGFHTSLLLTHKGNILPERGVAVAWRNVTTYLSIKATDPIG